MPRMTPRKLIEIIHRDFEYREGKLYWKVSKKGCSLGSEAGCIKSDGRREVNISKKKYLSSRMIFLFHQGYLPKYVDHRDGNKLNNHIENLRECTHSQNMHNSKRRITNTSGVKGLSIITERNGKKYWKCQMWTKGNLSFKSFPYTDGGKELAILWIRKIRKQLHGGFANNG